MIYFEDVFVSGCKRLVETICEKYFTAMTCLARPRFITLLPMGLLHPTLLLTEIPFRK